MTRLTIGFLVATVFTLGGCGRFEKEDDRICVRPPTVILQEGDMNACVHKWAYRLAKSNEPAQVVAKAVATACNDVANHGLSNDAAGSQAYRAKMDIGENIALFRVVQARAGHCDFP